MQISYVKLEDELKKKNIKVPEFIACCLTEDSYKFMRAQMKAEFHYSAKTGPVVTTPNHDEKCIEILQRSKTEFVNLLLFPEYCISYSVITHITQQKDLWPDKNNLWCLPCQAIGAKTLDKFIEDLNKDSNAIVLDMAIDESNINKSNHFYTILFYCFISETKEKEKKLILVPQVKTHAMADRDYCCEASGMANGSVIYIIGSGTENRIVTLLCADTLNSNIQWEKLRDKAAGGINLTILHPQLNSSPKHDTFARIRHTIFEYYAQAVHITCNWAKGTKVTNSTDDSSFQIELSWSCIYYKYKTQDADERWLKDKKTILDNAEKELYGAFMKKKKVAVWFATSEEVIHVVFIKKPRTNTYAVTSPHAEVKVDEYFNFDSVSDNLQKGKNNFCLLNNTPCLSSEYQAVTDKYKGNERYNFPLWHENKAAVDNFFALLSLSTLHSAFEIDKDENLCGWTLLLDDNEKKKAREGLRLWNELIEVINTTKFPRHLGKYQDNHKFQFVPEDNKRLCGNVICEGTDERLIVGLADDISTAQQFCKEIARGADSRETDMNLEHAIYDICVFGKNLLTGQYETFPESNADITNSDVILAIGDITNGGA